MTEYIQNMALQHHSSLDQLSFLESFIALCSLIPKREFPYKTDRIHRFWRDNKMALTCWFDLKFDYDGRYPTMREFEETYQTMLSMHYLFLKPKGKEGTVGVTDECVGHFNREIKPKLEPGDVADLELMARRFYSEVSDNLGK